MPIEIRAKDYIDQNLPLLKLRCEKLSKQKTPRMDVFLVGNDPSSQIYVNYKRKLCEKVGADCIVHELDEDIDPLEFTKLINSANLSEDVNGIIIQLPLPDQLKPLDVFSLVDPEKDIDGFHPMNIRKIFENKLSPNDLIPCTPKGILSLLQAHKISLKGKHVVVIGRSHIVGRPLSLLMLNENATVTMCHSYSEDIAHISRQADIIISAVGIASLIDSNFADIDKDQVFIDVGISRAADGSICGDLNFQDILTKKPYAISPVPGGVGPMTVYSLIENLIIATQRQLS